MLVIRSITTACKSGATFQPSGRDLRLAAQPPIPAPEHPNALIAADLDRDGWVDLAVPGLVSADRPTPIAIADIAIADGFSNDVVVVYLPGR